MAGYLKSNKIPWPTIVDSSREFEESLGLPEISLSNIYQVLYITPEGQFKRGDFRDLEGVADSALDGASWTIEPSKIPKQLRAAWRSIEFGNFSAAGPDVSKALNSKDDEVKSAGKMLRAYALKELQRQGNPAMKLARDGEFWPAYKEINRLCIAFDSYDLPPKLVKAKEILEKKDAVKEELRAEKKLQSALKLATNKRMISVAKKRLKAIIKDFPFTEAANGARAKLGIKKKQSFR